MLGCLMRPIEFDKWGVSQSKVYADCLYMANKQILQIENSRCMKDFRPILDINDPYFDLKLVAFKSDH